MTWCKPAEERLVNILRCSREALSGPELAARLGMSDRQTRALVAHLRKDHHVPICSSPQDGFSWPRTRRSADHTLACLQSRINEIQAVKDGIEIGMGHMFEQQSLFEEAV